ncbi:MAG: MarR family transcriptional regulator [Candidatus Latescibacterota bacterium]|nr:MAG: MarR family transcriptional regulator [Candidatus Latescibacterota bacterium]
MDANGDIRGLIEQTRPFPTLQMETIVSMLFTVDRLVEIAHLPLARAGLSQEQYNVLRILRGAGRGGLSTYRVAGRMVSRSPNIARLVSKLEEKGLLRRERSARDGRVRTLRITPKGQRLLAGLDAPMEESTRRAIAGLAEADIRKLLGLLEKVRAPLVDAAPARRSGRTRRRSGRTTGRE